MTTCYLNGKKISLTNNDFLTEGGEGKVYVKGNKVYKIFFDPKQMIPIQKIKELESLTQKNILGPKEVLYNSKNQPVGFTMNYISQTTPLPRVFTTSFRDRYGITPDTSNKLVENIMKTIQFIHDKNILIVDGNEFNYLVDSNKYEMPYFIDVNSYQTPSYPATAIMESIKDWQASKFSKETDWFSFAIVACQIFIGIHPFKGKHPSFKRGDIINRIKKNVSIFNKRVKLPPVARSFDLIPTEFRDWFIQLFEKGKRTFPPAIMSKVIVKPQITMVVGTDKFDIEEVFGTLEPITGCSFIFGSRIIFTKSSVYINKTKYVLSSHTAGIIIENNQPLIIDKIDNKLSIKKLYNKEVIKTQFNIEKFMICDNRIYIKNGSNFTEIKIKNFGDTSVITPGTTWSILDKATTIYRGLLISNVLGKTHFYIPYKEDSCSIIAVPDLDGYKIIDAIHSNGIVVVLGHIKGRYDRLVFKLDDTFRKYTWGIEADINPYGINFVSLPNNICVLLTGDDSLEIINRYRPQKKVLTNINIDSKAILVNNGNDVYFYLGNKLYSFRMVK